LLHGEEHPFSCYFFFATALFRFDFFVTRRGTPFFLFFFFGKLCLGHGSKENKHQSPSDDAIDGEYYRYGCYKVTLERGLDQLKGLKNVRVLAVQRKAQRIGHQGGKVDEFELVETERNSGSLKRVPQPKSNWVAVEAFR
jgi:hypothetical protein